MTRLTIAIEAPEPDIFEGLPPAVAQQIWQIAFQAQPAEEEAADGSAVDH